MRRGAIAALCGLWACSSSPPSLPPSGDGTTGGTSDADGGRTSDAADAPTTTGSMSAGTFGDTTSASSASTGTGGAMGCVPGMAIACFCPTGIAGAQTCNLDGTAYEPCECSGADTGGSTGASECDMSGDCQSCSFCAQTNDCAAETNACFDDPDCVSVVGCANTCTDQACLDGCLADAGGDGANLYQSVINCLVASCPACSGGG